MSKGCAAAHRRQLTPPPAAGAPTRGAFVAETPLPAGCSPRCRGAPEAASTLLCQPEALRPPSWASSSPSLRPRTVATVAALPHASCVAARHLLWLPPAIPCCHPGRRGRAAVHRGARGGAQSARGPTARLVGRCVGRGLLRGGRGGRGGRRGGRRGGGRTFCRAARAGSGRRSAARAHCGPGASGLPEGVVSGAPQPPSPGLPDAPSPARPARLLGLGLLA